MKKSSSHILGIFLCAILFLTLTASTKAQDVKQAVGYLEFMSNQSREISKDYLSYSSAVAHGKSARKVENRRKEMLQTNKQAIKNISAMPPFQGDKALRDSVVSFLKISYHILNEDYDKIVDLEEISEQSYDAMEAYLLAQDKANEKMHEAHERVLEIEKQFAANHNIRLIEGNDAMSKKLEQTKKVNLYHRPIYLIFFKSYKQEMYLLDAIQRKDLNAIEQNKNTLKQYSEEGLAKLKDIPHFEYDKTLITACNQLLTFYINESTNHLPEITSFFLKEENFNKLKKAMYEKRDSERTKEMVNEFNKAVNDYNTGVKSFNNTNKYLNENRNKLIESWNKSSLTFLDKHVPKSR